MTRTRSLLLALSAAALSAGLLTACAGFGTSTASSAPVTIKRDSYGVPHVYASDVRGLYYGFGYAVAEDRLYQLEMARRSGNGTVAQVLGAAYVDTDIATRQSLNPASIRAQLAALRP
jgi:penicillin amidase